MGETQKQMALGHLEEAKTKEEEIITINEHLTALQAEVAEQPEKISRLQKDLLINQEQEFLEWSRRIPENAEGFMLEQFLEQERTTIADIQTKTLAATQKLTALISHSIQTGEDTTSLHRMLDDVSLPVVIQNDEPTTLFEARKLRRISEQRLLKATIDLQNAEQSTASQRQSFYETLLRDLYFRQGLHEKRVEYLQKRISDRGRIELKALVSQLAQQEQDLIGSVPLLVSIAHENLVIGEKMLHQNEMLLHDRSDLTSIGYALRHIADSLRDSRARLDVGGINERVGRWLWGEQRRLRPTERLELRLKSIRDDLSDLRLERIVLNEQQRDLVDFDDMADAMINKAASKNGLEQTNGNTHHVLVSLLQKRAELLVMQDSLSQKRISTLEKSEHELQEQIRVTQDLQQMLSRHLLWIPSHGMVDNKWLEKVSEGFHDLIKPSRYAMTLELSLQSFHRDPLPWVIALLLIIVLIELRRRAPSRIAALAESTYQIRKDSYTVTIRALIWTIIGALLYPSILAALGLLLQNIGSPGRFSHSLGLALMRVIAPLFAAALLFWVNKDKGIAQAHFRWTKQRREVLRQWLPLSTAIVLFLYFVGNLAFIRRVDLAIDVQARIAIVACCIVLAWVLWRVLDVGKLWVVRGAVSEPSSLRKFLRWSLPLAFIFVATLAMTGYIYTAGIILRSALASFSVIVAIALIGAMLARWFLLGERRLALHRLEERRLAAEAAEESSGVVTPELSENVTLEQVNTQTGRLLSVLRITLLIVGLTWVWVSILPAVAKLDEIELWDFSETGPDGQITTKPVTLMAFIFGLITLMITVAGARNLPGLIEISLLSHIRIDAASRYAITSVLRYAIVIGGTVLGLGFFGMRWSQLQWMAAALSVGLGFGLQEIFANFVSGIILLFERPFRVGDLITVDEFSGRVTKIRTRATTILDFDNKEIVIPNKTFITGQLTNWTLTDNITRVIIRVGVAYDSDVNQVRALLLQAAQEDERVLKEPEPSCWFMAFGASTLDFELRVFVDTVNLRTEIQDAMNTRILGLFDEHHIEISFPQLDLHVRDVPEAKPQEKLT
ncbi:potassium transporter KefA [Nitrosomonas sp. PY1]|nr:potassium transporter KefA [Nitrosomonas sp. PY1]